MKKLFIIGLDGAPYQEVKEWIENGDLPFFSKLAKQGAFGKLKSTLPSYSMLAWPVIFTGKNPAKIGPFLYKSDKKGFDPEHFSSAQFINFTDIKTWSLWEWASEFGSKVGIVNIPVSYPPTEVNGFLIAGFMTPRGSSDFTYPPELINEIEGYSINIEKKWFRDSNIDKEGVEKALIKITEERTEWVLKLLAKNEINLFMINFKEFDDFMHYFWKDKSKILEYLKRLEKNVEKIYEQEKPDRIIFVSDHGFTDAPEKYFYINQYLEDNGYLKRAKHLKGKFSNLIYKFGISVVKKFNFIQYLLPYRFKKQIVRETMSSKVDWNKTKAYANWYAGIYLNPEYFPDIDSRKKVAEDLKKLLLGAKDPENGESIFLDVKTKWELYAGEFFEEMPDLTYTTTRNYRLNTNLPGRLFDKKLDRPALEGHHVCAMDGIILMYGQGIMEGKRIQEASVEDIFPTACALGELPIPEDVDGKVLKDYIETNSIKEVFKNIPYEQKKTFFLSEDEDATVKDHLKDLGYI